MKDTIDPNAQRKQWMGVLARAPAGRVSSLVDRLGARPDFQWLRAPEIGSVMVRGRAGGTGGQFNLGETTVTRCALRIAGDIVGHACIMGRRKSDAEAAALVDALMQTDRADVLTTEILDPLAREYAETRKTRARKAAATKVDFFTMVRGED